jgi:ribosomal protein S18 acetylase RimI-like enzyme
LPPAEPDRMHFAPLRATDRSRVHEILVATGAFADEEMVVALELFDAVEHAERTTGVGGRTFASVADTDYEFVGARDDDGTLLGYACYGPTPSTEGTFDLYWLAVHSNAQGRGAGRRLIEFVEQQLEARGARMLVAETSSRADYVRTREFYQRAGFAEAARVRDFYAPADDRIIYTTRLAAREVGAATP